MTEIQFLSLKHVFAIHTFLVKRYRGEDGVRDVTLLQSAIEMPKSGIGDVYFHEDVFEMAAAYLFHIAKNHPFVDGNKRTASIAALSFLEVNGHRIQLPEPGLADLTIAVAEGKVDKPGIADCFRKNAIPL